MPDFIWRCYLKQSVRNKFGQIIAQYKGSPDTLYSIIALVDASCAFTVVDKDHLMNYAVVMSAHSNVLYS
jgi:hypothetical protein